MSRYRLTPKARADLVAIWSHIAADNVEAADRVEEAIHGACALLAESPLCGHTRTDLTPLPVRLWTVPRFPNYVVVYDPATKPLRIVRLLHGAREMRQELKAGDLR
ncbi:MAG: type II toxin-antitoxin system RelE/ParE family toxin [Bryobacteraceae bacterium]|jgi:plasmid stabilization system protein ParE